MPARTSFLVVVTMLALSLSACATVTRTTARSSTCDLRVQDSTFAAFSQVYRDCAVDTRARLVTRDLVLAPARVVSTGTTASCSSAALDFVVDVNGMPDTRAVRITRSTDPRAVDQALSAFGTLRYEPARIDGSPVRQIVAEEWKSAACPSASGTTMPGAQ